MRTIGKSCWPVRHAGFSLSCLFVTGLYAVFQLQGTRTPSIPVAGKIFYRSIWTIRSSKETPASACRVLPYITSRRCRRDCRHSPAKDEAALSPSKPISARRRSPRHQEIRDIVGEFRAAVNRRCCFSDTMGEGEGRLSTYYLASAFSDIWVPAIGSVGIAGIGLMRSS